MPQKGRRSQAQKQCWRSRMRPSCPPQLLIPGTQPLPQLSAEQGMFAPELTCSRKQPTGYSHHSQSVVFVLQTVLIVGNSHLRAIVDGYVRMPESQLSFGFLSACGASASEIRTEVLHTTVPRAPHTICVMAPGNKLTSTTVDVAGGDFKNLLTTCSNRCEHVCDFVFVVDFPPRLAVDSQHQNLLRQEYRRVAARVTYFSATEHFPLSNLALWSKDGVHLSDDKGMHILVQLFWSAASQHLETPPPTPWVSPKTSPPIRKVTPKLVVRESSSAPRSPDSHQWRTIGLGGKESFLPLNPVWFRGTALSAIEKVSPSHLSCLADFQLSPKAKKVSSLVHILSLAEGFYIKL
uniref:Uncharacterized protein n=1 Tax=Gouania willdenowi TaxID=441366 RepID=A0A8C5DF01_GOUWI